MSLFKDFEIKIQYLKYNIKINLTKSKHIGD